MKKLLALMLALVLVLSFAACGNGDADKAPNGTEQQQSENADAETNVPDDKTKDDSDADTQQQSENADAETNVPDDKTKDDSDADTQQQSENADAETNVPDDKTKDDSDADTQQDGGTTDLSGYPGTKTGKFYSRFADGRMYMEYEMEMEGQKISVISATNGEKTYSESKIDGVSMGVSIMDGEDMYTIDHTSKMVIKMSLGADAQTIAGMVIEESDVDMGDLKTGTREIDGKTYDTEEWIVEGASSIMCFDGDALAYMIGAFEGEEMVMKVIEVSNKVDDSLFEIPEDYTVMEM